MQHEESKIRDLIAKHPEIISNELEFIDKEVYISDDRSIRVDILAWDTNVNRPTIIEIKKDELYEKDDESRKAIGQVPELGKEFLQKEQTQIRRVLDIR